MFQKTGVEEEGGGKPCVLGNDLQAEIIALLIRIPIYFQGTFEPSECLFSGVSVGFLFLGTFIRLVIPVVTAISTAELPSCQVSCRLEICSISPLCSISLLDSLALISQHACTAKRHRHPWRCCDDAASKQARETA